jgi:hypothetical protein
VRATHELLSVDEGTSQNAEREQVDRGRSLAVGTEGDISQDTNRNRASEGHSLSVEHIGKDGSRHERLNERGRLTIYRGQIEGQIRAPKDVSEGGTLTLC